MLKKTGAMILCIVMPLIIMGNNYTGRITAPDNVSLPDNPAYNESPAEDVFEPDIDMEAPKEEQEFSEDTVNIAEAVIDNEKIDASALQRITYDVYYQEQSSIGFQRQDKIISGSGKDYSEIKGVTCFRGNNYRDAPSYGIADIREKKLEKVWEKKIGAVDGWTGVGWNGQPAIIEWPESLQNSMNICEEKKNKAGLKEVIYGTLDSYIYFLDLEDGKDTRQSIKVPGPIKGSITVEPRGIPLLYAGQGINEVNGKKVEMGYRIYSLIDQKKLFFINGLDTFAYRG